VRPGDLGGDIEAQALLVRAHGAALEGLEQSFQGGRRNRFAAVDDGQDKRAIGRGTLALDD